MTYIVIVRNPLSFKCSYLAHAREADSVPRVSYVIVRRISSVAIVADSETDISNQYVVLFLILNGLEGQKSVLLMIINQIYYDTNEKCNNEIQKQNFDKRCFLFYTNFTSNNENFGVKLQINENLQKKKQISIILAAII